MKPKIRKPKTWISKPPRKQRAFAGLNPAEIHQITQWLLSDTYEAVQERIARPRPEGFGLIVSTKPLRRLFDEWGTLALQRQAQANAAAQHPDMTLTPNNALLDNEVRRQKTPLHSVNLF